MGDLVDHHVRGEQRASARSVEPPKYVLAVTQIVARRCGEAGPRRDARELDGAAALDLVDAGRWSPALLRSIRNTAHESFAHRRSPGPGRDRGARRRTQRTLCNCQEVKNILHNHDPKPRGFLA